MDTQQLHPHLRAVQRERDRTAEALVDRRLVRQCADDPLAARAEQDRATEAMEQREAVQYLKVVAQLLAEADARIDDDPVPRDARALCEGDPFGEPVIDLDQRVIICGPFCIVSGVP